MKKVLKYFGFIVLLFFLTSCEFGQSSNPTKKEVSYYIDNELVKEYVGSYSDEVEEPEIPFIEKIDKYSWKETKEVKAGTAYIRYDLEYQVKTFIVTFYDQNKKFLKADLVEYGASATPPVMEDRLSVTWSTDFSCVTDYLEVFASIEYKYYYIEYYDAGRKLEIEDNIFYPDEIKELPTYEKEGYTFLGWYNSPLSFDRVEYIDGQNTNCDQKLYAKYIRSDYSNIVLPNANYHFTSIYSQDYDNGTKIYQPVMPITQSVSAFNWTTSDTSVALVSEWSSLRGVNSGYCIITAQNKTDGTIINGILKVTSSGFSIVSQEEVLETELVKVTFKGLNDKVIDEYYVRKGFNIVYPKAPEENGYYFDKWSSYPISISEDTIIEAVYLEGDNQYTSKSYSLIGDSISTYYSYIPTGYAYFYPYPTADLFSFNQTWWMRLINGLGGSLFFNNSYSGSCVAAGVSSDSSNAERLSKLVHNGKYADYTIIYMGSNDCASQFTLEKFKPKYQEMINEILRISPNTTILLCTLPMSNLYSNDLRKAYNIVIHDLANENNLDIIELGEINLAGYLVDGAHPKDSGMILIAEAILDQFKNKTDE